MQELDIDYYIIVKGWDYTTSITWFEYGYSFIDPKDGWPYLGFRLTRRA